jgi:hypothetical protein
LSASARVLWPRVGMATAMSGFGMRLCSAFKGSDRRLDLGGGPHQPLEYGIQSRLQAATIARTRPVRQITLPPPVTFVLLLTTGQASSLHIDSADTHMVPPTVWWCPGVEP